jgi:hypothetical protein
VCVTLATSPNSYIPVVVGGVYVCVCPVVFMCVCLSVHPLGVSLYELCALACGQRDVMYVSVTDMCDCCS